MSETRICRQLADNGQGVTARVGEFLDEHRRQKAARIWQSEDAEAELERPNDGSSALYVCKRQQRVKISANTCPAALPGLRSQLWIATGLRMRAHLIATDS